jgi:hypothetical protein
MTCREYHLSVAYNNNVTDQDILELHCPHTMENATGDCAAEKLNPVATTPNANAAYSVSTFSFAALVLALIAASAHL